VNIIQLILFSVIGMSSVPQYDPYYKARQEMVRNQISSRGITDRKVLEAMRKVQRHLFVPDEYKKYAYDDEPLPIGCGQTISQPYIVAYMTEAVHPAKIKKALEIGTGSGYQAAVLAEIVDSVYTIEIEPELAVRAKSLLTSIGYRNIVSKCGDGYAGWTKHAPFDIIIVTAAIEIVPEPLISQLAENGIMIIPVGNQYSVQQLQLLIRKKGKIEKKILLPVRFVPFRRQNE
jgi:protein-L-isoaspartate(D-aspartate) O-methyltransferase